MLGPLAVDQAVVHPQLRAVYWTRVDMLFLAVWARPTFGTVLCCVPSTRPCLFCEHPHSYLFVRGGLVYIFGDGQLQNDPNSFRILMSSLDLHCFSREDYVYYDIDS